MALLKFGHGIAEIRGTLGGNYYHRDRFGNHCKRKPRYTKKQTEAQKKQRDAFYQARMFCSEQMCISTNIYRALNDLQLYHYNENRERVDAH